MQLNEIYLFVIAYNRTYEFLNEHYNKFQLICNEGNPNGFFIKKDDKVIEYLLGDNDASIYAIPKSYDVINDFVDDWRNGTLCEDELYKLTK